MESDAEILDLVAGEQNLSLLIASIGYEPNVRAATLEKVREFRPNLPMIVYAPEVPRRFLEMSEWMQPIIYIHSVNIADKNLQKVIRETLSNNESYRL